MIYALLAWLGSTRSSCWRELIASFVKTLRRWYWTVRGLINNCAAPAVRQQARDWPLTLSFGGCERPHAARDLPHAHYLSP
jgi:hypothetical protein